MNKIYLALLIVLLSGCHQNIPLTVEQLEKAETYCKEHNLELIVSTDAFDKGRYKQIIGAACATKDDHKLKIPMEGLE